MIEVSFAAPNTLTPITGAVQWDVRQTLVMHGIPSPCHLPDDDPTKLDTVEVHYNYTDNPSTGNSVFATYDTRHNVWLAQIPDYYLERSVAVDVNVYFTKGGALGGKTLYQASYTPAERDCPYDNITDLQRKTIDYYISEMQSLISSVNDLYEKLTQMLSQVDSMQQNAYGWNNVTVSAYTVDGDTPTVELTVIGSGPNTQRHFRFGLVRGEKGPQGDAGTPGQNGEDGEDGQDAQLDVTHYFDPASATLYINTVSN